MPEMAGLGGSATNWSYLACSSSISAQLIVDEPGPQITCGQPTGARPNGLSFSSAIDQHAAVD